MNWKPRLARREDTPILEKLIGDSVRALQAAHYSEAQMEAALGPVFGVDGQLIDDGTYFVVENSVGEIVGCGGWSKRRSLFGGDRQRKDAEASLDPATERARIRAFFVRPDHARLGIGRALLDESENAIRAAGFSEAELVATLAGEPLYAKFGFSVTQRYEIGLPNGLRLPVVRMEKLLGTGQAVASA